MQQKLLKMIQDHDDIYDVAVHEKSPSDHDFTDWIQDYFDVQIDTPYNVKEMS